VFGCGIGRVHSVFGTLMGETTHKSCLGRIRNGVYNWVPRAIKVCGVTGYRRLGNTTIVSRSS
jgi:hypothetical protein